MTSYKDRRVFGKAQLEAFLRAVDHHLEGPVRLVIIGGTAAALHDAESTTTDIDTYDAITPALQVAVAAAATETGLPIALGHAAVGDFPWNYVDRLERRLPDLVRLEIRVLERHDLALSKCLRGYDHDEQQIVGMHRAAPLDFDVLVSRFATEMSHVVGPPATVRTNFLGLIRLLFGELRQVAADKALRAVGR